MERLTHKDSTGWYIHDQSVYYDEKRRGKEINRLATYENTGLTPNEIRQIREENQRLKVELDSIRDMPNDPLTLEELWEMDGPVYIVPVDDTPMWGLTFLSNNDGLFIPRNRKGTGRIWLWEYYGKTWLAYRRKPEEVEM